VLNNEERNALFPCRGHPERPARITSIYELLNEYGLVDRCHSLQAREATRKELSMLHDSKYIDLMSSTPKMKPSTLIDLQKRYGSVFLCPETYEAAVLSAGSAIEVCDFKAIIIICC
jgi:histone deacetylase 6